MPIYIQNSNRWRTNITWEDIPYSRGMGEEIFELTAPSLNAVFLDQKCHILKCPSGIENSEKKMMHAFKDQETHWDP